MKKKKTPLSIPVLWFATTAVILVRLCYAAHTGTISADQRFLLWLFMAVSLAAAVVNLKRYKRDRKEK